MKFLQKTTALTIIILIVSTILCFLPLGLNSICYPIIFVTFWGLILLGGIWLITLAVKLFNKN